MIYSSLFNDRFLFQLTDTIMKLLGLLLAAIFISLLKKLTFMARILSLQVQLMPGITHRKFPSDIYLLIKSKKLCKMTFCWDELSTFRYFRLMLFDFSDFAGSISILTFSLCRCYFIISGLPLIYWTKLPLPSIQLIVA